MKDVTSGCYFKKINIKILPKQKLKGPRIIE